MKNIIKWLIIFLVMQDFITQSIPIFSYLDEALVLLSAIYIFFVVCIRNAKMILSRYEKYSFILIVIYIILGLISNYKSNIVNIDIAIISILITIKGYILYFQFRIILKINKIDYTILEFPVKFLKYSLYIFTIIGIVNIPFDFLKTSGMRFGIQTVAIGFSHVTELAFFAIASMCVIIFYSAKVKKIKNLKYIIFCSATLVIFSGRSKAIAFFTIFILLYEYNKYFNKIKIRQFIILSPFAIYIGLPRVLSELVNGARGALYFTSVKVANDCFPLGSGFGTFGSYISRLYYSPLYHYYGISTIWGLSPEMPLFIADTYWAMIIGETGYLGLLLIISALALIYIQFIKVKCNNELRLASISLIIYTLMSSIAEPIYSSNKSAAYFVILALFITIMRDDINKNIVGEKR